MRYINQLNYRHIPYHTHVKMDVPEAEKIRNVAKSGCGLCCACMVVDLLTAEVLTIEDCVKISEECLANHGRGTDMTVLAPVIAEKYGLEYAETDDLSEVISHLQKGGKAIALVGVPEGKSVGLFTKGRHFICLISTDGEEFCILDPSYAAGKFDMPERAGKVNDKHAPYLYCGVEEVHAETVSDKPKYTLFSGRKG